MGIDIELIKAVLQNSLIKIRASFAWLLFSKLSEIITYYIWIDVLHDVLHEALEAAENYTARGVETTHRPIKDVGGGAGSQRQIFLNERLQRTRIP